VEESAWIAVIHVIHRPYIIIIFSFYILKFKDECLCLESAMTDLLANWYPWVKAFHVMSVIAWMAGLFYLPRLYVYHTETAEPGSASDAMLQVMERKLLRAIMNPAMIATWAFGLALVATPGIVDWSMVWPWTKAASVIAMSGFHMWLSARRKDFENSQNRFSGRAYRISNEAPTLLMIVIVLSVIVKF
jgi:protoporphyrinogen IX oxidase